MNWIEKIKAPKLYRYMFFKLYALAIRTRNDTPAWTALLSVSFTTLLQLFFLIGLVSYLIKSEFWKSFFSFSPLYVIVFLLIFLGLNYILFYYKNKWEYIIDEFEGENRQQSKRGFVYLFIYLFISLFLLFGPALWMIFYGPWWK